MVRRTSSKASLISIDYRRTLDDADQVVIKDVEAEDGVEHEDDDEETYTSEGNPQENCDALASKTLVSKQPRAALTPRQEERNKKREERNVRRAEENKELLPMLTPRFCHSMSGTSKEECESSYFFKKCKKTELKKTVYVTCKWSEEGLMRGKKHQTLKHCVADGRYTCAGGVGGEPDPCAATAGDTETPTEPPTEEEPTDTPTEPPTEEEPSETPTEPPTEEEPTETPTESPTEEEPTAETPSEAPAE